MTTRRALERWARIEALAFAAGYLNNAIPVDWVDAQGDPLSDSESSAMNAALEAIVAHLDRQAKRLDKEKP